jgi:CRISPR system Cascade subunit CasA
LVGVLARAHELRGLANESPLVDAAIFRLLLAVLHRCFGPPDNKTWRELYERGAFDQVALDAYFDKWRGRFDLFHAERPFYQVAGLVQQSPNYERGQKPAREMIAEQSAYGAPRAVFESRPTEDLAISASTAARWLTAIQAFHPGGLLTRDAGNGDPTSVKAGPLCSVAVVTVRGATLFESLMLNLLPYPQADVFPSSPDDAPAWEQPPLVRFQRRACRGWLDWLTWQSRRMQLMGDGERGVSEFLLLGGVDLLAERAPVDPMCAYRVTEKFGRLPVALDEERALWRDSAALFQVEMSGAQRDDTPRSARVVSELTQRKIARSRRLQLQIYGQVPNKASLTLNRSEVVPLPLEVIEQPELVGCIREELGTAEKTQSALRGALYFASQGVLSLGERRPDSKDAGALVESTQAIPRFWAALKPVFDTFILALPVNPVAATAAFRGALCAVAEATFERAADQSASPLRALKGFAQGRAKLQRDLRQLGLRDQPRDANHAIQAEVDT